MVNAGATYGAGYYGYPAYTGCGAGWTPGSAYYDPPYTAEDIEGLELIDTGAFGDM